MQNDQGLAGYEVFKHTDGTAIRGVWLTSAEFPDSDAIREGLRSQVLERLKAKIPPDLVDRQGKARRLLGEIREDLNSAAEARSNAANRLTEMWDGLATLDEIKAAESSADDADRRVNQIRDRMRLVEGKLIGISGELEAILNLELQAIEAEPAPIPQECLDSEKAIQKSFDKHAAAMAEGNAIRFAWWTMFKRADGMRQGAGDLVRQVLSTFEHGAREPEAVEA